MAAFETSGGQGRSTAWLTPTGAGIAALVIATLSLLADGAWTYAVQGWLNRNGPGSFSDSVVLTGVAQVLLAGCALLLAGRALRGPEPVARHLGGAAAVVGGLGMLVAALTLVAGVAGF
ncbi:hypothetical protein [Nocardioides sp.]|uniref:hypothetical protein n=1 Tax=Nocardioides sp. TaxID=35761 RepID=UPI00262861C8|nr:hypothetical protein [Nocardioides sp.]MDI6908542.1 hypothetical protein [Nocardioides sp.]